MRVGFVRLIALAFLVGLSPNASVKADANIFRLSQISASDLIPYYRERLRQLFPHASIETTGPLQLTIQDGTGGAKIVVNLDNLLSLLNQEPRNRRSLIQHFLDATKATATTVNRAPSEKTVNLNRLLPLVRSSDYFDSTAPDQRPVSRGFASGIAVFFSYDAEVRISYVQPSQLKLNNISEDQLFQMSLANFEKMASRARVNRSSRHHRAMVSDESYSSSLPLSSSFYARMLKTIGSNLVIAIPQRDLVLVASADDPVAIDEIRGVASRTQSPYWVSRGIYRWSGPGQLSSMW